MERTIFVDVEGANNCPYSLQQVFSGLEDPCPVHRVRLYHQHTEGALYDVTGWSQEGPSPAMGVTVEDSGQGRAYLVYGGDDGVRLRSAGSPEPWALGSPAQWGEPYLLLSDAADVLWE